MFTFIILKIRKKYWICILLSFSLLCMFTFLYYTRYNKLNPPTTPRRGKISQYTPLVTSADSTFYLKGRHLVLHNAVSSNEVLRSPQSPPFEITYFFRLKATASKTKSKIRKTPDIFVFCPFPVCDDASRFVRVSNTEITGIKKGDLEEMPKDDRKLEARLQQDRNKQLKNPLVHVSEHRITIHNLHFNIFNLLCAASFILQSLLDSHHRLQKRIYRNYFCEQEL